MTWEYLDTVALLQHLLAFTAVIACIIVYFFRRRYYAWVLLGTLLLGCFNLINFTPFEVVAYLRVFYVLKLQFQPLVALVAGVALAQLTMGSRKPDEKEEVYLSTEKLADFKERYGAYDTERLQEIVRESRYVPEALEAARQVLEERNDATPTHL